MNDGSVWINPFEAWSQTKIRAARLGSRPDCSPEQTLLRGQWTWVGELRTFFPGERVGTLMFATLCMWDSLPETERGPLVWDENIDDNPEARAWVLAKCEEYKAIALAEGLKFPSVMMSGHVHAEARALFPGTDAVGMVFRIALDVAARATPAEPLSGEGATES